MSTHYPDLNFQTNFDRYVARTPEHSLCRAARQGKPPKRRYSCWRYPPTPLTDREVLAWLTEHIQAKGYAPTARDICRQFEFKSTRSGTHYLQRLEYKGFIEVAPGIARGIRLLSSEGKQAC